MSELSKFIREATPEEKREVYEEVIDRAIYRQNEVLRKHMPLSERIDLAKQHIKQFGGGDYSLWPYQDFSITVEELLEAASK